MCYQFKTVIWGLHGNKLDTRILKQQILPKLP